MNIIQGFFFAFTVQAVILAIILLFKKSTQRYQNRIWAIFLLLFALNLLYNVTYWIDPRSRPTIVFSWSWMLLLALYGPLFYFYVRSLVTGKRIVLKRDFFHFLPFVFVLLNFGSLFIQPFEIKRRVYATGAIMDYALVSDYIVYLVLSVGLLVYAWVCYRMGRTKYSDDPEMKAWLNSVVFSFFLFGLSWLIFYAIGLLNMYTIEADYVIGVAMVFMIALTSYFGYIHSDVFNGKPLKNVFSFVKYKNSGLSKQLLVDLREKLANTVQQEGLYLDCELKLTDLADKLNISRHHTSQVINESFGVSFYEYINSLRIQEAEKLLADEKSKHLNITDIAYKSGFNNRVSFYNSFKKHFGITPSEFRSKKMMAAS
ncbi:MAG: helix-turn-helix transcriptional regulator [Bacteroidota bacterium]